MKIRDQEGTTWLESQGFRVLRFRNHQALGETDVVVQAIANALDSARPNGFSNRDL